MNKHLYIPFAKLKYKCSSIFHILDSLYDVSSNSLPGREANNISSSGLTKHWRKMQKKLKSSSFVFKLDHNSKEKQGNQGNQGYLWPPMWQMSSNSLEHQSISILEWHEVWTTSRAIILNLTNRLNTGYGTLFGVAPMVQVSSSKNARPCMPSIYGAKPLLSRLISHLF
jgi:hypothetical protein